MTKGVVIAAFGGARDEGEVEDFLRELKGEVPPREFLEVIKDRYRSIGGSPFFAIVQRIVEGLRRRLRGVLVDYGVLYGTPSLEEVIDELEERGAFEILIFPLSPYRSPYTTEVLQRAERKLEDLALPMRTPSPWFDHPEYLKLWASRVQEAISSFGKVPLLFTAHSLPRDRETPYLDDLRSSVMGVTRLLPSLPWRLGFHGWRPGWIGPTLEEALDEFRAEGKERVIVVPLGFPCDHLETLYDLDVELRTKAEERGMSLERVPCLNASEDFVTFLAKRVLEAFQR